jgi:hypothetical protein
MVTYSLTVAPIISANCLAPECHGGTAEVSGIPLEGYENLTQVDSNRLIGSLLTKVDIHLCRRHTALPECEILSIEQWVNEGSVIDGMMKS